MPPSVWVLERWQQHLSEVLIEHFKYYFDLVGLLLLKDTFSATGALLRGDIKVEKNPSEFTTSTSSWVIIKNWKPEFEVWYFNSSVLFTVKLIHIQSTCHHTHKKNYTVHVNIGNKL